MMIARDDVKLMNCARCDCELLGPSMLGLEVPYVAPFVAGRLADRPYCRTCYDAILAEDAEALAPLYYSHQNDRHRGRPGTEEKWEDDDGEA